MTLLDCLVIGAGQSGLVSGVFLKRRNIDFLIVERANQIGDSWRNRPDQMLLFTSRQFCALPGLNFPGDPEDYPDKNEMVAYLQSYARHHALPVRLGQQVCHVEKQQEHFLVAFANGRELMTKAIINATGSNQLPVVPDFAAALSREIIQMTAADYRSPTSFPDGSVLVVGDGASGRQIAAELATSHQVAIARGSRRNLVPNRVFGKDLFWWLDKSGLIYASSDSLVGRLLRKRNPIPCLDLSDNRLARIGVECLPKAVGCQEGEVLLLDGVKRRFDAIVWAIGYRDDTSWLGLPHCKDHDGFVAHRSQTPEPGLFMVGKKWLSCRASELLLGAARDAEAAVKGVVSHLDKSHPSI